MNNYRELKEKFDAHQIDVSELSFDEVDILCDMYEEEYKELVDEIQDLDYQIETNKNNIRRNLNQMRQINNRRKFSSGGVE